MKAKHVFISLLSLLFVFAMSSCASDKTTASTNIYDVIPVETSIVFEIINPDILKHHTNLLLDQCVQEGHQIFLSKIHFKSPFLINILLNNSKLKGFVAVGSGVSIDSIFNDKSYEYQGKRIMVGNHQKKQYYATQIFDKILISNQKLLIENCIRDEKILSQISKNPIFIKGIKTLDQNADLHMMVQNSKLLDGFLYPDFLPKKFNRWTQWEFYDDVDATQHVYTGMALSLDSVSNYLKVLNGIESVANNCAAYIPYSASENLTFSFEDVNRFWHRYQDVFEGIKDSEKPVNEALSGLQAMGYFIENNNKGMVLMYKDVSNFIGEEPIKINNFSNVDIFQSKDEDLVNKHFKALMPDFSAKYYANIENYIILAENEAYLHRIINNYQNKSTLALDHTFKELQAELPENYSMIYVRNRVKINGENYMLAHTYKADDQFVFTNIVLKVSQKSDQNVVIEQVLSTIINEEVVTQPQLVFNHQSKSYNIIYQNGQNELVLLNLKGKVLWKTTLKEAIVGRIYAIDLFRNHKIQYTFVTPHHWYVIDRLGRNVENFPNYFMQKITQGIAVFDYDHNRKYRFGITQGRKFRLFDNQAKVVKGFKVKTNNDITATPQHFRIGNKDILQLQDKKGELYLLNRRGETRIKVNQNFEMNRNNWGVYQQKIVGIDDVNRIISIDTKGHIKEGKLGLGDHILARIASQKLAAVSNNKILINNKIVSVDIGKYQRPFIVKDQKKTYILLSNSDNEKIYGFDEKGNNIPKFPVVGSKLLDVKIYKGVKYILAYDTQNHLIVYRY